MSVAHMPYSNHKMYCFFIKVLTKSKGFSFKIYFYASKLKSDLIRSSVCYYKDEREQYLLLIYTHNFKRIYYVFIKFFPSKK